ncbi:glycoside hydrolase, partial [Mycena albidolilacea]
QPLCPPVPPPSKPEPQETDAGLGTVPSRLSDVSSRPNTLKADTAKRDAVVDTFRVQKDAFGDDEYHPVSHRGSNLGSGGGIGYTVADALDTMLLMGLESEYTRPAPGPHGYFSTFEPTIRVLGGLLSAFFLTGDDLYKHHAADLGDWLTVAFDTPSGLPGSSVNLGGRTAMNGRAVNISEATMLQLEFRHLAEIRGRHKAEKAMKVFNKARLPNGLAPIWFKGEESREQRRKKRRKEEEEEKTDAALPARTVYLRTWGYGWGVRGIRNKSICCTSRLDH